MKSPADVELMAIGESMIVLVADEGVPLEAASRVSLHCAGAESNVAYYLAQLRHRVGWASRVGDDPFGRRLLREFTGVGIDVSEVRVASGERTGVYFKDAPSPGGVYYYRTASAASAMSLDELLPAVHSSPRLHVTGITAALSASSATLLSDLMNAAAGSGVAVSFDVNYRPALWERSEAAPTLARLAKMADTVFVGRDEAEGLWQKDTPDSIRAMLREVPTLIVKDGAVGATAFELGVSSTFVPAPQVAVVEPVGAGDAFAAGYLSAEIRGLGMVERLRLGHLLAAQAIGGHADYAAVPPAHVLENQINLSGEQWQELAIGVADRVV
ncbi:sugar kinase (plasmid) [Arthrobacter sp. zg-Y820]|uniref:sugar kinase n=1 Tax=unclassified Arthrobacter TaxID=235627 RepID=UPI001E35C4B5|nr:MULTISPECIES: sugar kinase [unclassified Arthrobacter]MCC9198522.1 sugar kinase [Arthrobacter sp. zg-Y820]MDK1281392.1 sugar kinase [Arthrobacter sp. zg.Y820]WIB11261.1 sugar kinase [Arthrobacter sp. zg-Y820]